MSIRKRDARTANNNISQTRKSLEEISKETLDIKYALKIIYLYV